MKKIISGEKIVKSFGAGDERHIVLDSVTIDIHEGEFISVMGPSGSGKSTLLFVLSGMDGTDGGRVVFRDRDLSALSEKERADMLREKMGFVFQQPTFLRNLNILDNILLPSMHGKRKHAEKNERARMLMDKVGIAELGKRSVTQVSGGQLQRAGICRALMSSPEIVFGDEPTGALNSKTAQEIMDILSAVNADGVTVMLVTHDAKVASRTERILFMSDGKLINELKLPKYDGSDIEGRVKEVTKRMREAGI